MRKNVLSEFNRSRLAGSLLILMLLGTTAHGVYAEFPSWFAGVCAWGAGCILVTRVGRVVLLQICFLSFLGGVALYGALKLGGVPQWPRLLDANVGILTMLAAVSFLRIIGMEYRAAVIRKQRGAGAFAQTILGVAVFGGFINISAPILIADRISRGKRLSLFAAQSITRVFPGGASWSPFFAGMAVVLTYVPGAHFLGVMTAGLPFAAIGVLVVILEARIRYREDLDEFEGYPMTRANLKIPLVLTILVIISHIVLPEVSILIIISLSAIAATMLFSCAQEGVRRTVGLVKSHIAEDLSGMAGELLLFLAAGILATGLGALIRATDLSVPVSGGFDASMAGILLGGIIVISAVGIHPIVSITVTAPLLVPMHPDPLLLALTYAFSWSLGACASPLSGMNLIMQGRYGISSGRIARHNWSYAALMVVIGMAYLQLVALIRGG